MPHYNLRRSSDQKTFSAQRLSDQSALFYFSVLAGEALSFDGEGPPPYLLGSQILPTGPVETKIPVYRAGD